MIDKIDGLIEVLLDNTAREDERDDAAMDLGRFNDERAFQALLKIATNANENEIILDSCGESIAEILIMRKEFRTEVIETLAPIARETAKAFIREHQL